MKLAAEVVIVRKHPERGWQVLTQTRTVVDKEYDPLYDGTQEVCGETVEEQGDIRQVPRESIVQAALRGMEEELGIPESKLMALIGGREIDTKILSTRPGQDLVLWLRPYCFVQQLLGPQPWAVLGFVAIVRPDTEPRPDADAEGEVGEHTWWDPKNLLAVLKSDPAKFIGIDYPIILQVCQDLIAGKLAI